jgi:hypothetical protein
MNTKACMIELSEEVAMATTQLLLIRIVFRCPLPHRQSIQNLPQD